MTSKFWRSVPVFCLLVTVLAARGFGQFVDASAPPHPLDVPAPDAKSTAELLAQLNRATPPPTVVAAGDVYDVTLVGIKDYEAKGRVAENGLISLPLAGELQVAGLGVVEVQRKIAQALKDKGLVLDPQVNFAVTESPSQMISVSGELNRPGSFPAFGHHTLYEYIARAEGLKVTAARTILLVRPGYTLPFEIPLGPDFAQSAFANVPVFAGDAIVVPAVGMVYVVGAVKVQGGFPLKTGSPTTVLQAVGLAQGAGYEAVLNSSVIVRSSASGTVEIPVRLRDIMKGKTPDVALMANDILLVPTNQMRAGIKGGAAGLAASLAASVGTAFIYTH